MLLPTLRPNAGIGAWPLLLLALAGGLLECLALWRSRLGDRRRRPG